MNQLYKYSGQFKQEAWSTNNTPQFNNRNNYRQGQNIIGSNNNMSNNNPFIYANPNICPKDSIQSIEFQPLNNSCFSVCSWDLKAILYNFANNQINKMAEINLPHYPLASTFIPDGSLLVATGDNSIYKINFSNRAQPQKIYQYSCLIIEIIFVQSLNVIVTATQDNNIQIFMLNQFNQPVYQLRLQNSILAMDIDNKDVIVGLN